MSSFFVRESRLRRLSRVVRRWNRLTSLARRRCERDFALAYGYASIVGARQGRAQIGDPIFLPDRPHETIRVSLGSLYALRISQGVWMNFLEFEDNGRTLTCRSASSPATPGTNWWWLDVTGDSQRYAAFRAEPGDTPQNLRPRILAWHAQLLLDRARPREFRPHWSQRGAAAKAANESAPEAGK
jgi:hypothetical protein